MRQFRGARAPLAVLVIAVVLLGAALLATRVQTPAPVAVSPTPAVSAAPSPTATVARASATPSPTASPTLSPTPTASPGPSKTFLQTLTVDGVTQQSTLTTAMSSVAPGTTRFTITFAYAAPAPARAVPGFTVQPSADGTLAVTVPGATDGTTAAGPGRAPIRSVARAPLGYVLALDGFPLWRALVLFEPTRIAIDVGAPPGGVSDDGNTAVYSPVRDAQVSRTFHLSGAVRAFEATYLWRVKDSSGKVLAGAPGVASIGTSALWGSLETDIALPATASGVVRLEVYQVSPKDGSEVSTVAIPLEVR